jgi:hypothetical protein
MSADNAIFFSKDRPYYKSTIRPILERKCFQVGNVLYKTRETAAKKMAWGWIFKKYGGMKNTQSPSMESITELYGMTCACCEDYGYQYDDIFGYPADDCPIHDRKTGYFRRLHKRVVRAILSSWNSPIMTTLETQEYK